MVELKNIQGCKESSEPLIIGKDTVYIHSNVKKEKDSDGRITYTYDEVQMTKDEYLAHLQKQVETADATIADLIEMIGSMGGEV